MVNIVGSGVPDFRGSEVLVLGSGARRFQVLVLPDAAPGTGEEPKNQNPKNQNPGTSEPRNRGTNKDKCSCP